VKQDGVWRTYGEHELVVSLQGGIFVDELAGPVIVVDGLAVLIAGAPCHRR